MTFDRTLPPLLTAANALDYDYDGDDSIDFEPYDEFQSADDNASWIKAWTGNKSLDGSEYRVFGQDGTGGYAALWLVNEGQPLEAQPVVFFGSEGELGVVAKDLAEYAWLVAGNFGPLEAVSYPEDERTPNAAKVAFAKQHAPQAEKPAVEVIRLAQAAFPDFEKNIRALCG